MEKSTRASSANASSQTLPQYTQPQYARSDVPRTQYARDATPPSLLQPPPYSSQLSPNALPPTYMTSHSGTIHPRSPIPASPYDPPLLEDDEETRGLFYKGQSCIILAGPGLSLDVIRLPIPSSMVIILLLFSTLDLAI